MTAAIADKQQWAAYEARSGVFEGVGKGARWLDFADKMRAARPTHGL